ncbi:hypothetical protein NE237_032526 [Protea cynaroides]|uniref:B3 domain-containing protein n=1 Tax=Protea cynaroides TaxID=273540 RepID=A0A9Q0R3H3_9MAGN|nr:hypothetical protein NE237_032526 [Protea cynaroides]
MEFKNHREFLKALVRIEFESLGINPDSVLNNEEEMKEFIISKRHQLLKIERQKKEKEKEKEMENTIASLNLEPRRKMMTTQMDEDPRQQPTTPTMPRELLNAIHEHGGDDVMWVIEKTLTATDVSSHQNRLSIPENKIGSEKFLTDAERRQALQKKIPVDVLVLGIGFRKPELWSLIFKKWRMNKSGIYVLIKNWGKLVVDSNLHMGDIVQIWSFRVSQNGGRKKLCFAINVLHK